MHIQTHIHTEKDMHTNLKVTVRAALRILGRQQARHVRHAVHMVAIAHVWAHIACHPCVVSLCVCVCVCLCVCVRACVCVCLCVPCVQ